MQRVLGLAEKGRGKTSPNPMVGAVLVKNGRIVGQGYHHRAGSPHAEIEALKRAGRNAQGSTLYVNLEPCCHFGKTPPCTDAIIKAGIRKAVYAVQDPNPRVSGKGARILRRAGVETRSGLFGDVAAKLNESYFKFMQTGKPLVTLVIQQSLDGKKVAFSESLLNRVLPPQIRSANVRLSQKQQSQRFWYNPYRQINSKEEALGFLDRLANQGILSLTVYQAEGTGGQLLKFGLVDKLCCMVKFQTGGNRNSLQVDLQIEKISEALRLRDTDVKTFAQGLFLTGYLN